MGVFFCYVGYFVYICILFNRSIIFITHYGLNKYTQKPGVRGDK